MRLTLLLIFNIHGARGLRAFAKPEPGAWATDDCWELSKPGFPLPVQSILAGHPSKMEYFDYIRTLGYDESLHVVPRGNPVHMDSDCLKGQNKEWIHMVFVGDCMERQSWEAFARNAEYKVPPEVLTAARQMSDTDAKLRPRVSKSRNGQSWEIGEDLVTWSDHTRSVDSTYVRWYCGSMNQILRALRPIKRAANSKKKGCHLDWMCHPCVFWRRPQLDLQPGVSDDFIVPDVAKNL
mmetsp:Transcript_2409/g.7301  ORF Transcript_2409/g.7301 Transcript_2409/m.7301 type:complete len:237 (+) Transcript_2409:54-764(+)